MYRKLRGTAIDVNELNAALEVIEKTLKELRADPQVAAGSSVLEAGALGAIAGLGLGYYGQFSLFGKIFSSAGGFLGCGFLAA